MYVCSINGGITLDLDQCLITIHNTRESAMNELNDYLKIAYDLGFTIREDLRYSKVQRKDWRVIVRDEDDHMTIMVCSVYEKHPKD